MALANITSWLTGTDSVFGMEVHVHADLQKEYRLVHLVKKNGSLNALTLDSYKNVADVIAVLPQNSSVVFVYTGKGVINREYTFASDSVDEVVQKIFPDVRKEDFFSQLTPTTAGGIISLIRKDIVLTTLKEFESKKIHFLALTLGPFITTNFFELIHYPHKEFAFELYRFKLNDEYVIIDYENSPNKHIDDIHISGENIPSSFVNAYSFACTFLLTAVDKLDFISVHDSFFESEKDSYKSVILKNRGGLVFLVTVLIILLANFLLFSELRKKNIEFQEKISISKSKLNHLDSLESFLNIKKNFISNAGWAEKTILSKTYDIVAQTVPNEIRLTELTIHPINIVESRNTKAIVFTNKKIVIKGLAKKIVDLNDWLKVLSTKASITELKMEEYHFDTNTQEGQFKLEGFVE